MRSREIGVALHYIPIYRQPHYLKYGYAQSSHPHAEDYYSRAISLPIYPHLQAEEIQAICKVIADGLDLKI
jgi:dTDP-4-amino-4,6-dideoxygalactose transaminase